MSYKNCIFIDESIRIQGRHVFKKKHDQSFIVQDYLYISFNTSDKKTVNACL